ncbi:peptidylprolyl isomerase [Ascidiimonas sp. W6]|uniref:peptidylprolyl isomerase n=1 Tax=Ascidiimonas meishanensis TaxID=3128903 RepID=UPI0030EB41CF
MKNLKVLTLLLILALVGCKDKNYKDLGDGLFADIQTNYGDMIVQLTYDKTPITAANFVSLAEGTNPYVADSLKGIKFYDGVIFHRVIKDFMIQGGDRSGTGAGSPGYRFDNEIADSLTHNKAGIISMANAGPNTNGSQFFITHKPSPFLDGQYNIFGEVVLGLETVDSIAVVKTENEKPVSEVIISKITIVRNGKEAKNFDAPQVMKNYFDGVSKKEEEIKSAISSIKENFEKQKAEAKELPSGLKVYFMKEGEGKKPAIGQSVLVNYAGFLENDAKLFDTSWEEVAKKYGTYDNIARMRRGHFEPSPMLYSPESPLVAGFREGLMEMKVGDKARLFIPSHLGYGSAGAGNVIPPNASLVFDLEIMELVKE